MKHKTIILIILLVGPSLIYAQTKDIKERASKDRNSSSGRSSRSSRSSSDDDDDSSCCGDFGDFFVAEMMVRVVGGAFYLTSEAQKAVLESCDTFPERVGIDVSAIGGIHSKLKSSLFNAGVRGNWGIFATDLRFTKLNDHDGDLSNFDWQVLMVRVPIKSLKLEYGIGFTNLQQPSNSWFESSIGFELGMMDNRLALNGNYRWTERKAYDTRFRQESSLLLSYNLHRAGLFHTAFVMGYTYQNYYSEHDLHFIRAGLKFRIY